MTYYPRPQATTSGYSMAYGGGMPTMYGQQYRPGGQPWQQNPGYAPPGYQMNPQQQQAFGTLSQFYQPGQVSASPAGHMVVQHQTQRAMPPAMPQFNYGQFYSGPFGQWAQRAQQQRDASQQQLENAMQGNTWMQQNTAQRQAVADMTQQRPPHMPSPGYLQQQGFTYDAQRGWQVPQYNPAQHGVYRQPDVASGYAPIRPGLLDAMNQYKQNQQMFADWAQKAVYGVTQEDIDQRRAQAWQQAAQKQVPKWNQWSVPLGY